MTFNFLGPGLTVNVEAKVKEQIILDSSENNYENHLSEETAAAVFFCSKKATNFRLKKSYRLGNKKLT